jgi:hypothetical protein
MLSNDRPIEATIISNRGIDQSRLPIFEQDWWVDIARNSAGFRELTVLEDGLVVGRLAFTVPRNRLGFRSGGNLPTCHLGGPALAESLSPKRLAEVLDGLLEQLPPNIPFHFIVSAHVSYAPYVREAFKKAGFKHSTQANYLRRPTASRTSNIVGGFSRKRRAHINSADRTLEVMEINSEDFISFYRANLKASGRAPNFPLGIAQDFIAKGICRGQVRVIAAQRKMDNTENVNHAPYDAAVACAWDKERYYYWLSTRRHADRVDSHRPHPHPDAIKLLILKAMSHAEQLGLTFDADGATTPGRSHLYKDILSLHEEETRDVFERITFFARLFNRIKSCVQIGLSITHTRFRKLRRRTGRLATKQAGCHTRMLQQERRTIGRRRAIAPSPGARRG